LGGIVVFLIGAYCMIVFFYLLFVFFTNPEMTLLLLIFISFFTFLPGFILIRVGLRLIKRRNKYAQPSFQAVQISQTTGSDDKLSEDDKFSNEASDALDEEIDEHNQRLDEIYEKLDTIFDGTAGSTPKKSEPKLPVSVDCPGCGSKITLYPKQATQCEYCGTKVPYREK